MSANWRPPLLKSLSLMITMDVPAPLPFQAGQQLQTSPHQIMMTQKQNQDRREWSNPKTPHLSHYFMAIYHQIMMTQKQNQDRRESMLFLAFMLVKVYLIRPTWVNSVGPVLVVDKNCIFSETFFPIFLEFSGTYFDLVVRKIRAKLNNFVILWPFFTLF